MSTKAEIQRQAFELPEAERVELALELWESLEPKSRPIPDWHREVIRERLEALDGLTLEERSSPWEQAHSRVFERDE